MKFDPILIEILSELSVDLSAGWFGAAFIAPNFAGIKSPLNFIVLTTDVLMGILCLIVAFKLRKLSKRRK